MDVWYSYFLFAVTGLCQVSFLMSIKDKLTISVATKIPKMTKMRSLVSDLVTCLVEVKIMGKKKCCLVEWYFARIWLLIYEFEQKRVQQFLFLFFIFWLI